MSYLGSNQDICYGTQKNRLAETVLSRTITYPLVDININIKIVLSKFYATKFRSTGVMAVYEKTNECF